MPIVTINRKLNLVLPAFETEQGVVHVHSIPLGKAAFEQCYDLLCETFAQIQGSSGLFSGPTRALMDLKRVANLYETGSRAGSNERFRVLMAELQRLTTVIYPTERGWQMVPLARAEAEKVLTEDQTDAVESILVFFTVLSLMIVPDEIKSVDAFLVLYKAQTTPLNAMEFLRSLPTSTPAENTGATEPTPLPVKKLSSVPV